MSESVYSIGGMILTGENRGSGRQTCPDASLSITNLTWTDLGLNLGLRSETPATNGPNEGRFEPPVLFNKYLTFYFTAHSKHAVSVTKAVQFILAREMITEPVFVNSAEVFKRCSW
jgi:hypothetical protein